jgi:FixJ family two-component response regulator
MICTFGYDATQVLVKARRAGVRYLVQKPLRADELQSVVERLTNTTPGAATAESASRRHG